MDRMIIKRLFPLNNVEGTRSMPMFASEICFSPFIADTITLPSLIRLIVFLVDINWLGPIAVHCTLSTYKAQTQCPTPDLNCVTSFRRSKKWMGMTILTTFIVAFMFPVMTPGLKAVSALRHCQPLY